MWADVAPLVFFPRNDGYVVNSILAFYFKRPWTLLRDEEASVLGMFWQAG